MKFALLILGLAAIVGVSGGLGYAAVRGNPATPVLSQGLPMSIRNGSAIYRRPSTRSTSRSRGGYYYGSSSRRHYGGGYSSGK